MTIARIEFTNSQYVRAWGKNPRGEGGWAFAEVQSRDALDRDVIDGTLQFFYGTLTEAKKQARAHYATSGCVCTSFEKIPGCTVCHWATGQTQLPARKIVAVLS
jgi:hypothetical protein